MTLVESDRLTRADLDRQVKAREPAALLVRPRILRRVLSQDRGLTIFGLRADRHGHVLPRETLLRIAYRRELGVGDASGLAARVYLFARPSRRWLKQTPAAEVLRVYWRRLFHARVRVELERRAAAGLLNDAILQERVARIGWAEFDEARAVLRQENLLAPTDDRARSYEEFVALYLELLHFDPERLPYYFPALQGRTDVPVLLASDVSAAELLERTRLPGANPAPESTAATALATVSDIGFQSDPHSAASESRRLQRAAAVAERGNVVRAAVMCWRAGDAGSTAALEALTTLVQRLEDALDLSADEAAEWQAALARLLPAAAAGLWPVERRLLYDLQRICVDREQPVYASDLFEWVRTLGRKPIQRELPHRASVLVVQHLRRALRRALSIPLEEDGRHRLRELIERALQHAEHRLRDELQPRLRESLAAVGLRPESFAEEVARDKLVAELLDRIVQRGFLTLGDLRDALARNRLKLPDLTGPLSFLRGDQLLRANERLAADLDGVYRRGEVYLRLLQRFSALAFGTWIGRCLTRYLILPLLGTYVVLEGLQHVVDPIAGLIAGAETASTEEVITETLYPSAEEKPPEKHFVHLVNYWSMSLGSLFLFGLLNFPSFRRLVGSVLRWIWRGLRGLAWDLPRAFLELPAIKAFRESWAGQLLWRFLIRPALFALLVFVVVRLSLVPWVLLNAITGPRSISLAFAAGAYVIAVLALNTRTGQFVEEVLTDRLAESWYWLHHDVLPGLFRAVLAFFKRLVEEIERFLYAVDEWLRFRSGDSQLSVLVKPVLTALWAGVAYVIRFAVNLLIEPQINPIKHFPVVTVSHKVMLTAGLPIMTKLVKLTFGIQDDAEAIAVATVVVSLIPGIFGFLAWELKENWRLYRANQSPTLDPVMVGHHGETVPRLLRPGFHAGTVPKLFARLRRADGRLAERHDDSLHHVGEAVEHFLERGLAATLAGSRRWGGSHLHVRRITLATNRIRAELAGEPFRDGRLRLDFEEHAGWLVLRVDSLDGALNQLNDEQSAALNDALVGTARAAGVDVVHAALRSLLPAGWEFAATDDGLVTWRSPANGQESRYSWQRTTPLVPEPADEMLPLLMPEQIDFRARPVTWAAWVQLWEADRAGRPVEPLLPEIRLFARAISTAAPAPPPAEPLAVL